MDIVVGLSNESPDEINLRLKLLSETSGLKFKYSWFKSKKLSVSSTDIKKKLRSGIKPDEVPGSVYDYIVQQNLYSGVSSA